MKVQDRRRSERRCEMAKKGLLTKMFGKQNSDCCSVSFEEVSKDNTGERREERTQHETGHEEAAERQKAANENR